MRIAVLLTTVIVLIIVGACVQPVPILTPQSGGSGTVEPAASSSAPVGSFFASYYNNTDFTQLVATRVESSIDHNWSYGAPLPGVGNDTFSVRWVGNVSFDAGTYTFTATSDDGERVWVDGQKIIDAWYDQGATAHTATIELSAGIHSVRMDYYEDQYKAVAKLSWASVETAPAPTPQPPSPTPVPPTPAPTGSVSYASTSYGIDSTTNILNPERGWFDQKWDGSFSNIASQGYRLVFDYEDLGQWNDTALPRSYLDSLSNYMASASGSGVKIIMRFRYQTSGHNPDPPLSVVLEHIKQLGPVLNEYSQNLAVMQAGFIGNWGEWTNLGIPNSLRNPSDEKAILDAELQYWPKNIMIQMRTPYQESQFYPDPVTSSQAFGTSAVARIGQGNDCFLSDYGDEGTFRYKQSQAKGDADYAYLTAASRYTAMGGETCNVGLNTYNECPNALKELAAQHWDFLNSRYWTGIYDQWKSQGCYDEITNRFGYRLALVNSTLPSSTSPGSSVRVALRMQNSGFGKVYNERPMYLVLVGNAGTYKVQMYGDARRQLPLGGETRTIAKTVQLPSNIPSGSYRLYLWLPDPYGPYQKQPIYSIRLANTGTWQSLTGYNDLKATISVS